MGPRPQEFDSEKKLKTVTVYGRRKLHNGKKLPPQPVTRANISSGAQWTVRAGRSLVGRCGLLAPADRNELACQATASQRETQA